MSDIAIKIEGLSKIYPLYPSPQARFKEALHPFRKKYHNDYYALKDISLEVKKGETMGILGRNGAGKSTLLKIITGVLTPSSGIVKVNGRLSSLLELGAGFNPEMTGVENIYFYGTIHDLTRKEVDAKFQDIVEFADIGEYIHQIVKSYSSGMFARLAFAAAIIIDPDILIVDEALAVGDIMFQRKCITRMMTLKKKGKTIIFVSHSEQQVIELCDRALMIHQGKLMLDGDAKKVCDHYLKILNLESLDLDIEKAKEAFLNSPSTQKKSGSNYEIKQSSLEKVNFSSESESKDVKEYFDKSILPKSRIEYEPRGAKISDVKITTLDGRKVNVLNSGKEYIYSYKVKIFEKLKNVQLAMLIKTTNGIGLGGGAYPNPVKYIDEIEAGESSANWYFKANFSQGVYFTNAGLMASSGDDYGYLHRIIDAYAFKIIANDHMSTGYVNFLTRFLLKS